MHTLLTHGSPESITSYIDEDHDEQELQEMMDAYVIDILIIGHTHKPYHRLLCSDRNQHKIYRHLISVGSVGQPRDSDMRAAWCSIELNENSSRYDPGSVKVNIHRVRYDWDYTIRSIKKSKIPNIYADLLGRFIHFNA